MNDKETRLGRGLGEGPGAIPKDLDELTAYLRLIAEALEEKASEHEASRAQLDASAAEIEALQSLELSVVERASEIAGDSIRAVLLKCQIWRMVGAGTEAVDQAGEVRERLASSIEADLRRLERLETR